MTKKSTTKRVGAGGSLDAALALQAPLWKKRRAIVRELDRAYLDPTNGYRAGQSDTTVQRNLRSIGYNVELNEIKAIRAELFGPIRREIRANLILAQVQKVRSELARWREELNEKASEAEAAIAAIEADIERLCRGKNV